jgi:hypothetical protein
VDKFTVHGTKNWAQSRAKFVQLAAQTLGEIWKRLMINKSTFSS